MQYEDRLSVPTPEGVEIEMTLAGFGSRMAARALDLALSAALALLAALGIGALLAAIGAPVGLAFAAGGGFVFFALLGYDLYFETNRAGQTPGKRRLRIRVLRDDGGPVDVRSSVARNAMRLVDELGTLFVAGTVAIVRSDRNQRLGDLAAGTIVVTADGAGEAGQAAGELTISVAAARLVADGAAWDTSGLSEAQLAAAKALLDRRDRLSSADRGRLARQVAAGIRPDIVGPEEELDDEQLLEVVVALRARRGS